MADLVGVYRLNGALFEEATPVGWVLFRHLYFLFPFFNGFNYNISMLLRRRRLAPFAWANERIVVNCIHSLHQGIFPYLPGAKFERGSRTKFVRKLFLLLLGYYVCRLTGALYAAVGTYRRN